VATGYPSQQHLLFDQIENRVRLQVFGWKTLLFLFFHRVQVVYMSVAATERL
jgi:hypothetical protein